MNKKSKIAISFLQQDASLHLSWAQRKEVAVWAATIFYIGVIYVLFKLLVIDKSTIEYESYYLFILVFNLLFLNAITYFIRSNFNSIYNSNAYYLSVKRIINNYIDTNTVIPFHNSNPEIYVDPDIIIDELQYRLNTIQPYFDSSKRPLKIVVIFWVNFILPKPCKKPIGENLAIQEASLYSLLFLSTILFWLILIINYF